MDEYNLFSDNYDYDESPKPARNEKLINLYERLCALVISLPPNIITGALRDGSGERFNSYVDEFIKLTDDPSLSDFKVEMYMLNGKNSVKGSDYVRQLTGISAYIHKVNDIIGYYCAAAPKVDFGKGTAHVMPAPTVTNHMHNNQENTQTTSVTVEFTQTIVNMTESLTRFEAEYPDPASKENKFAKAVKKGLPMVKDTLGITAMALKIAGDLGINPHTALKALGLS